GDESWGPRFSARVEGGGPFDVTVDVGQHPFESLLGPLDDQSCGAALGDLSGWNGPEPAVSSDPLVYTAPAGTLEALGIGAVLDDPRDGRSAIARAAATGRSWPSGEVWLPEDLSGLAMLRVTPAGPGCALT